MSPTRKDQNSRCTGPSAGRGHGATDGARAELKTRPVTEVEGLDELFESSLPSFGAAYLRWVLHLIPDWRAALGETMRVVGRGGVILVSLGGLGEDTPQAEIQRHFAELARIPSGPSGLTWGGYDDLDATMAELGATARSLPSFTEVEREGLDVFVDGIAQSRYSWSWRIEDPGLLERIANDVRRWAEARFGALDRAPRAEHEIVWRAYDLPA